VGSTHSAAINRWTFIEVDTWSTYEPKGSSVPPQILQNIPIVKAEVTTSRGALPVSLLSRSSVLFQVVIGTRAHHLGPVCVDSMQ
jgi:hypothetical protein